MRLASYAFSLCLLAAITFCPAGAQALEHQWQLGPDAGWAGLSWHDSVYSGWGGGVHATYGLTDAFNVLGQASLTTHSMPSGQPNMLVANSAVGLAYTLDVIQWVPYFGALLGGYRLSGAELTEAQYKFGFQTVLGMDYRASPSLSLGAQLRYHTFSDDVFGTHYVTTFVRAEYLWGW